MKRIIMLLLACCLLVGAAAAAGGSGTAADPYIIQTAAELQSMQNNLAAYYKLGNDINLQGISFTSIGSPSTPFIGSFDGAGYTISNMVMSSSTESTGFFSCLGSGAIVKNTIFQDCSVTSTSSWCGVVIGSIIMSSSVHETATISNVDCVRCSASTDGDNVGCLVGLIYSFAMVDIIDCDISYSDAESLSFSNVACLVGQCNNAPSTKITNCNVLYSHARANRACVSFFVGRCADGSSLVIDSSSAHNSVVESLNNGEVGCFVGHCYLSHNVNLFNCDAVNCIIIGYNYVGGIIGDCQTSDYIITAQMCDVSDCTIVASTKYAGGVAGHCTSGTTGIFSGCSVTDTTIIASDYAAGVCPAYS